jgi:hypothetical protein
MVAGRSRYAVLVKIRVVRVGGDGHHTRPPMTDLPISQWGAEGGVSAMVLSCGDVWRMASLGEREEHMKRLRWG